MVADSRKFFSPISLRCGLSFLIFAIFLTLRPAEAAAQSEGLVAAGARAWKPHQQEQRAWELREQGQYEGAIFAAEKGLALAEKELGPETPCFARFLYTLARLYSDQGSYSESPFVRATG